MVGVTNEPRDDILRQQLQHVIDEELHKLEFAALCKKIATNLVERVQKIDNQHNEIKSLYGELGARVANLLAPPDVHGNDPRYITKNYETRKVSNGTGTTGVITIDDDDDDGGGEYEDVSNGEAVNAHTGFAGLLKTVSPPPSHKSDDSEKVTNGCGSNKILTEDVQDIEDVQGVEDIEHVDVDLMDRCCSAIVFDKDEFPSIVNDKCAPSPIPPSASSASTSAECESVSSICEQSVGVSISVMEEEQNVEVEGGNNLDSDVNDGNEWTENADADASMENTLSLNTLTDTAISHLDISESESQSSSVITDDVDVQSKSSLILKLKTVSESGETAKTCKYSSTVIPDLENPDMNSSSDRNGSSTSSSQTEASASSINDTEISSRCSSQTEEYSTSNSPTVTSSTPSINIASSSTSTNRSAAFPTPGNAKKVKRKPFVFLAGSIVYAKPCGSDIWYEAELLKEVFSAGKKQPKYQVRFLGGQRLRQRILLKSIATKDTADSGHFEIGIRVVAGRPSDTVNSTISKKYKDISSGNNISVIFAGIVAELACEANRNRYLVFFDDGYAQYFNITSLYLVIRPSRDVWNDIEIKECQTFAKKYLEEYPYRLLVCTMINSTMQTEWNGEWWKSKVVSVDSSLVKILFDVDKRSEWLYRGNPRLEPLYNFLHPLSPVPKRKKSKKEEKSSLDGSYVDTKVTHPQFGISKYSMKDSNGRQQKDEWDLLLDNTKRSPLEEAMAVFDFDEVPDEKERDKVMPKKLRIQSGVKVSKIEKKIEDSTISSLEAFGLLGALHISPNEGSPKSLASPNDLRSNKSKRMVKSANIIHDPPAVPPVISLSPTKKSPHTCDPSCIRERRRFIDKYNVGVFNYLSVPFKVGFKRESSRKKYGGHRDIYYRTPCNKRLRSLSEVTTYLSLTKCSNLAIDMFCFYSSISCRNQSQRPKPALAKIDDLSGGKETCPIVCVNEINEELPNPIVYISNRLPAEDVYINTDPGFLTCCDCIDNCQDKTKCGCAQLTIESSNAIDDVADQNAGYQYRRLKDTITTGIYECNHNCSCSRETCYNRVVQNGIQLRLQVFMTDNRGWGLRCIDDIPKGTFICTYTGQVLNEQTANKEGIDFGDEYLAELDHIEVVEKAKDDYESDVPELRDNITISSDDDSDSDNSSSSLLSISSDSSDVDENNTSRKKMRVADRLCKAVNPAPSFVKAVKPTMLKVEASGEAKKSNGPMDSIPLENGRSDFSAKSAHNDPSNDIVQSLLQKASDILSSSLQSVGNEEFKPIPNNMCGKPSSIGPDEDSTVMHSDVTVKAFARKSTANNACAHKNNGGKRPGKITAKKTFGKSKKESNNLSTRNFYDGDKQMYVIDAKCFGNVGRFMNHSCSPNLFVQNVMVDTHDLRFPWVAFFAQQNIQAQSELTWDYSYEIGSVADKTLTCKCGSKNCRGRLL